MNPGQLRDRVEIQSKSTPDHTGDIWTKVRDQWARVEPISASKLEFGAAQGARVTHLVKFREKPIVTVAQRFIFDTRTYLIIAVQPFIDRQEAQAELIQ